MELELEELTMLWATRGLKDDRPFSYGSTFGRSEGCLDRIWFGFGRGPGAACGTFSRDILGHGSARDVSPSFAYFPSVRRMGRVPSASHLQEVLQLCTLLNVASRRVTSQHR